jgi:large subunit ribosomal protein L4
MPQTTLYDRAGKNVGTVDLDETLFAAPVNEAVLHQAVVAQLAGRRTGTHDTKTRGEVRGGGHKPYRQKGTGRARQGSKSAPHYSGGGVVFGPHPRSYEQRLNKKMRRIALRSALSAKLVDDAIRVVDVFLAADAAPKTKTFAGTLAALGAGDGHARKVLVIAPNQDASLLRSTANLPKVTVLRADSLNVVDILDADAVLIEQPALARISEVYADAIGARPGAAAPATEEVSA